MSAYVPPWKCKAAATAGASPSAGPSSIGLPYKRNEDPSYPLTDIVEHLGGRKMGTINLFSYAPPPPVKKSVKEMLQEGREKEKAQRGLETTPTASSSLLNSDASKSASSEVFQEPYPHGHLISWIHIVPDAHPMFLTENELWFHTNSDVVVDHTENLGRPIPFFGQPTYDASSGLSLEASKFTRAPFHGYWTLNSYHTVPPRSDELRDLLTAKQAKNNYGPQGRTAESWRRAMDESWIKVKVERYRPEAGEEEKWKDPLQVDFGGPGQDKGEAWLDFVLRDVASRRAKVTEPAIDANVLVKPIAKTSIGGPAPKLPEPTVPVIPSEFKDDQEETPEAREQRMVHDVYETIAPHFSQTRYKPWPIIARFLSSIPEHSIGLDSGAGNGKYLPVVREGSKGSRMIALDRSSGLLSVARAQKGEVGDDVVGGVEECVRGDLAFDGWRKGVFDFAISIAAVHHLSTRSRRVQSICSLLLPLYLSPVAPYSKFIVYVWAYEQGENSKRKMGVLASPPEDHDEATGSNPNGAERKKDQDVLVPWVLQGPQEKKVKQPRPRKTKSKPNRGAANEMGHAGAGGETASSAMTTSNDDVVSRPDETTGNTTGSNEHAAAPEQAQPERQVFHRYYHLFVEGELREDVVAAAIGMGFAVRGGKDEQDGTRKGGKWLRIIEEGYEKDNWYLEGEVGIY